MALDTTSDAAPPADQGEAPAASAAPPKPQPPQLSSGTAVENADGSYGWAPDPGVAYADAWEIENGVRRQRTQAEYDADNPPVTLDALKAAKVAAARAQLAARLAAGFAYQGQHVAIDDGSRANLTACALEAVICQQGADQWPADYARGWITVEGGRVQLPSPADGLALARGAGAYYAALAQHEHDLELAAEAAADPASVAAVDETAGWPVSAS